LIKRVLLCSAVVGFGLMAGAALPEVRYDLWARLRGEPFHGGHGVAYWAWQLRDGDESDRVTARMMLSRIGEPAVPHLVSALGHHAPEVRQDAAAALVAMTRHVDLSAIVPELLAALGDPDPIVRANAAEAQGHLRRSSAEQVVPRLRERLEDPNQLVRRQAEGALERLAGKED
jgi:HEAT repeat protein